MSSETFELAISIKGCLTIMGGKLSDVGVCNFFKKFKFRLLDWKKFGISGGETLISLPVWYTALGFFRNPGGEGGGDVSNRSENSYRSENSIKFLASG